MSSAEDMQLHVITMHCLIEGISLTHLNTMELPPNGRGIRFARAGSDQISISDGGTLPRTHVV